MICHHDNGQFRSNPTILKSVTASNSHWLCSVSVQILELEKLVGLKFPKSTGKEWPAIRSLTGKKLKSASTEAVEDYPSPEYI
jgi:hypothetical protein